MLALVQPVSDSLFPPQLVPTLSKKVYLAAVYFKLLTAEILELAGNAARDNKKGCFEAVYIEMSGKVSGKGKAAGGQATGTSQSRSAKACQSYPPSFEEGKLCLACWHRCTRYVTRFFFYNVGLTVQKKYILLPSLNTSLRKSANLLVILLVITRSNELTKEYKAFGKLLQSGTILTQDRQSLFKLFALEHALSTRSELIVDYESRYLRIDCLSEPTV